MDLTRLNWATFTLLLALAVGITCAFAKYGPAPSPVRVRADPNWSAFASPETTANDPR